MRRYDRFGSILLAALLLGASLGCTAAPQSDVAGEQKHAQATAAPQATPTPIVNVQSGTLDAVLLDGVELFVIVSGYTFTQGEGITLDVAAENRSGSPATVWTLVSGVNGWDVRNFPQAMTNVALAPGEKRTIQATFDLSTPEAAYLQISSLLELTLSVEGYVDTTNYDYLIKNTTLQIPDAPEEYAQPYGEPYAALFDSAALCIGYCGRDGATGGVTLYCEARALPEDATIKLYPIEKGVYDTQRYLIPEVLALQSGAKQLYTFTPPKSGGEVTAFYLLIEGSEMSPSLLPLPDDTAAQGAADALDGMALVAETEWLTLYYNGADRRFYAQNRTADRTLTLTADGTFLLDGKEARANPNTVLCFPGTATAFRISGRAKDDGGVERNVIIEQQNSTLSASFVIADWESGATEPPPAKSLAFSEFDLTGGAQ